MNFHIELDLTCAEHKTRLSASYPVMVKYGPDFVRYDAEVKMCPHCISEAVARVVVSSTHDQLLKTGYKAMGWQDQPSDDWPQVDPAAGDVAAVAVTATADLTVTPRPARIPEDPEEWHDPKVQEEIEKSGR